MKQQKWLKIALLVVLLAASIFGSFAIFQAKKTYIKIEDDFDKMGNAYISTALLKSYETNQDFKYEIVNMKAQSADQIASSKPSNEDMKKLFEGFKMNLKTSKSLDDKYNVVVDLILDNTSFVKMDVYSDDEKIVINLPGVYEKKLYAKFTDVNKILKRLDPKITEEIDLNDYKDLLSDKNLGKLKEIDGLSYYKTIKAKLKDGFSNKGKTKVKIIENGKEKVYNCDNYELSISQKQMIDTLTEVINKFIADEKVKGFAKDKANEIIDILVKTNDYKLFDVKLEEINKFKEDFNKDYDKNYEEFVKGFKEGFEKGLTESNGDISAENKVKYAFEVDGDYNIRKLDTEQITTTEDITLKMLSTSTVANPNKEVKVVAPELKDALNLADLTDKQFEEMGTQIAMSVYGKAMQSPSIQKVIMPYLSGANAELSTTVPAGE